MEDALRVFDVALGDLVVARAPALGAVELLDRKKLTKQVGASVAAAYPDLPVTKVRCPKKVKVKAGVTATINFIADQAGTYEVDSAITGDVLLVLEVQ